MERKKLSYEPEPEEKEAGINTFSQFGEFSPMYALAGGDITKFNAVIFEPYIVVFRTLLYRVTQHKYEKRLREIYKNKAKK
jgi:hypothetical protein